MIRAVMLRAPHRPVNRAAGFRLSTIGEWNLQGDDRRSGQSGSSVPRWQAVTDRG